MRVCIYCWYQGLYMPQVKDFCINCDSEEFEFISKLSKEHDEIIKRFGSSRSEEVESTSTCTRARNCRPQNFPYPYMAYSCYSSSH